jgi:hypothetical protein
MGNILCDLGGGSKARPLTWLHTQEAEGFLRDILLQLKREKSVGGPCVHGHKRIVTERVDAYSEGPRFEAWRDTGYPD